MSTIAGDGAFASKDNVIGTRAQVSTPYGIDIAPDGNTLYVADGLNILIRKITLSGTYAVSTIARRGSLVSSVSIAVATDVLYVVDRKNMSIRKIALPGGRVSSFATGFKNPYGIAVAPKGNTLYVADTGNHQIKKITLNKDGTLKAIIIIAGNGTAGNTNGTGTTAQFSSPTGIAAVSDIILYVVDSGNNSIRKLEYKE